MPTLEENSEEDLIWKKLLKGTISQVLTDLSIKLICRATFPICLQRKQTIDGQNPAPLHRLDLDLSRRYHMNSLVGTVHIELLVLCASRSR